MRATIYRGAWLLTAWLALSPGGVGAQGSIGAPGYAPAHPVLPVPLSSTRPEDGGLYLWTEGVLYHQTNPLKSQLVAVRGFRAFDNSIPIPNDPLARTFNAGTFFGSGTPALNVDQLTGQDSYQPGFTAGLGWRFRDGSSLSLNWTYVSTAQYRAGATLAPRRAAVGNDQADSFLYSDVFNFPPEYAGPDGKIGVGSAQVAFGIWNGASIMTESFRQRFQQWEIVYRWTAWETEDYRFSGLVGPKFAWFWEKYRWDTTSLAPDGNTGPQDLAIYTNITSNRMYGAFVGCQNECYLGHGFAVMLDTRASLFINSVKERAKYELADKYAGLPQNKRSKREFTVVPEFQASLGGAWYPSEGIQVYFGYDVLLFMNTLAARRPVDFDYSNLAPKWSSYTRFLDGFRGGFAIQF